MTISPCSQRPANRCAVKLRWNAAPALSISERESSPLWLPLNTGKSFCHGQRGAGEPTCCTRLKSLSQWVQIRIGRQCWNFALPLNLPHERLQLRTNRLTDKLLWLLLFFMPKASPIPRARKKYWLENVNAGMTISPGGLPSQNCCGAR